MTTVLVLIGIIAGALLLYTLTRGAPYVPTHRRWIEKAIDMADKQGTLVDLGSGDGSVVLTAAKRGIASYGIEINPFLVGVSRWRLRKYQQHARIVQGDYLKRPLPDQTTSVFLFTAGPFLARLQTYLQQETDRIGREITLVSYGFAIDNWECHQQVGSLFCYKLQPSSVKRRK